MAPAADLVGISEPAPAAVPTRQVDFTRPRVCLLGLPFDPIRLGPNCLLFQQVTLGTGGPVPGVALAEPVGPASKTPA